MLVAYVTFNGNTEEVFNFYKDALEGEIVNTQRFGDAPSNMPMPEEEKKKIMHIELRAPHGVRLMGNDFIDFTGQPYTVGNNASLSLHPDSDEVADKVFNNLSAGGHIIVPMGKAPWGDYFGMFVDKFGMKWMVNHAG